MNIGFYGHSITEWDSKEEFSFIKKIKDHYSANIVHLGTTCCSEERTLFELKKTKKLDLAIIFHSKPQSLFVPGWTRDVRTIDQFTILKKINNDWVETLKNKNNTENDIDAIRLWYEDDLNGEDRLIDKNELIDALLLMKKYLFHPDLQMNRYYGALIQIDEYLLGKKIPVVHCLGENSWYPDWFVFQSGITDDGFLQSIRRDKNYFVGYDKAYNGINSEGNNLIYKKLVELINAASSRVGSTLGVQSRDGGSSPPAAPQL